MEKNIYIFSLMFCLMLIRVSKTSAQGALLFSQDDKESIQIVNESQKLQSINPALNTGAVSNLPSINLTSIFSDTRAEARFAFNAGKSLFNIGVSQSFSSKPKQQHFWM